MKDIKKMEYEKPEMLITELENEDIITSSGKTITQAPVETPDPNWIPGWF